VEKDIQQPKKNESDRTREKIKKFEEMMKEYFNVLKKEAFYTYATGVEPAQENLAVVKEKVNDFEKQLE